MLFGLRQDVFIGIWPAFWVTRELRKQLDYGLTESLQTCGPNWPYGGEIDVLEGVHDNEHNQVTWHTAPGCNLTPNGNFTGTLAARWYPRFILTGSDFRYRVVRTVMERSPEIRDVVS